jgi:endo-1,3-1,4-beta-glycanase ExoK
MAASATAHAVASAELYRTQAYRFGRFEARIRYGAGDGVISSFFLWKDGSEASGAYWNELDFEKLGADCHMQTNTLYGNPQNSGEKSHSMPADMCTAYHTYAFEWTPTYLAWTIDAKEIRRETGSVVAAFADNAPQGMTIHFNIWPGNANFGGNFNPASLPVRQFLSWVQYSSFQDGAFHVEWREDFTGAGVPSGWSTGTWASPLNLSTHDARNVTFADGIATLSLTADGSTGFTEKAPPDGGGGTTGNAGASGAAGTPGGGGVSTAGGRGGAGGANSGGVAGGTSGAGGAPQPGGANSTSGGAMSAGTTSGGAMSAGRASGGAMSAGTTSGGAVSAGTTSGGALSAGTANGGTGASPGASGGTLSGGVSSATGGTSSGGSAGQPSTANPPAKQADSSGCNCSSVPSPGSPRPGTLLIALAAAAAGARTRRRRRGPLN